ncbi:MAG: hypothetical protein PHP39_03770 [Oscillospiraceae bacterium]|nr:hypothetical protein [Oscillospiraceae bacterium]
MSGGRLTTCGDRAYLVLQHWDSRGEVIVTALANKVRQATLLANKVRQATLLATGESLPVRRDGRRLIISGLPVQPPFPWANVIRLELDGPVRTQYYYQAD